MLAASPQRSASCKPQDQKFINSQITIISSPDLSRKLAGCDKIFSVGRACIRDYISVVSDQWIMGGVRMESILVMRHGNIWTLKLGYHQSDTS